MNKRQCVRSKLLEYLNLNTNIKESVRNIQKCPTRSNVNLKQLSNELFAPKKELSIKKYDGLIRLGSNFQFNFQSNF
jgi:hypothetical protein